MPEDMYVHRIRAILAEDKRGHCFSENKVIGSCELPGTGAGN